MRKKIFAAEMLVFLAIIANACSTGPGEYDSLAQCLTGKAVAMYGTEWCSHCQNQKEAFGSSFQYIDFVDCDKAREVCAANSIEGYPTWIINGEKYSGEQPLSKLARLSGCGIS